MRLALILAFTASFPINAASACHRFHIWRYPTPQRCGYSPIGRGNGLKIRTVSVRSRLPAPDEDKSWYVEIIPSDDDLHAIGVDRLKQELKQ